jgi:hypothetical protein
MTQAVPNKRLALVEFDYDITFNKEEVAILQEIAWVTEIYLVDKKDPVEEDRWKVYDRKVVLDYDRLPELRKPCKVLKFQSNNQWEDLSGRNATVINQRVNVAVPGIGLLQIREVRIEDDLCTEVLQNRLDDGWRILAICPQPDQRRPDYVLGRFAQPKDDL